MADREQPSAGEQWLRMPQLRERGWTPAMVRDLLGEPDQLRGNPVYRTAPPMRLWSAVRVADAEANPGFTARRSRAQNRSASSAKAADRKRDELLEKVSAVEVSVPQMSWDALVRCACEHYNALQLTRGRYDYDRAAPDSNPAFLERIVVNYLRHELSDYEPELAKLFGQVGRADATSVVRERVYDAIAGAYPDLAEECDRQLRDRQLRDRLRDRSWP